MRETGTDVSDVRTAIASITLVKTRTRFDRSIGAAEHHGAGLQAIGQSPNSPHRA